MFFQGFKTRDVTIQLFFDSQLNLSSDKVLGFNSNSIFQDAHCITTQLRNSIQPSMFHLNSVHNSIQLSKLHIKSIHNSIPLNGGRGVFWQISPLGPSPHYCWVYYTRIQLEIEPQPQCCQVWLVQGVRMTSLVSPYR